MHKIHQKRRNKLKINQSLLQNLYFRVEFAAYDVRAYK